MSLVAAVFVTVFVLVLVLVHSRWQAERRTAGDIAALRAEAGRRMARSVMVYDGPGLPEGFVPPSGALSTQPAPEPPVPARCGSCPLYGCEGCRLRAVDSVGRPLVRPATPYRPRIDRCGYCVRNAAAGHEFCIDCDRAFEVIPAAERGAPVASPAARLLGSWGYPREFIASFLNPGVEVTVAERAEPVAYLPSATEPLCPNCHCPAASSAHGCDSHRYPPPTGPGAAGRRDVRSELRCLACVQPVIVDSDGVWLHHAAQCPRVTMPLEVAIGQRPPDPYQHDVATCRTCAENRAQ